MSGLRSRSWDGPLRRNPLAPRLANDGWFLHDVEFDHLIGPYVVYDNMVAFAWKLAGWRTMKVDWALFEEQARSIRNDHPERLAA